MICYPVIDIPLCLGDERLELLVKATQQTCIHASGKLKGPKPPSAEDGSVVVELTPPWTGA